MAQPTQTFGPWLKQKLVEAGEISPDAQGVNLDPKVRDAYLRMWQNESKAGANFTPSAIAVTNPVNTNQVIPVLTTSPNSVQPLPQPRLQYKPDKDGNLMAIEGTTANYVTNTTGERVKIDPKSNRLEDIMAALGDGGAAAQEESPGFFSRIFGGVASSPAPAPTPAPTPAMTNAPAAAPAAPAPTPAVFSTADFKQMTGRDLPPGEYVDNNGRPFTIR